MIPIARLIQHYRMMAKWEWHDGRPDGARFFNMRCRVAIREYRQSFEVKEAA